MRRYRVQYLLQPYHSLTDGPSIYNWGFIIDFRDILTHIFAESFVIGTSTTALTRRHKYVNETTICIH